MSKPFFTATADAPSMTQFHLYTSNSLEHLATVLGTVLREPLENPLRGERILVQSGGMQRWISMRLAQDHGILANARFPFPVAFAHELCTALLPGLSKEYPFSKERMTWRILSVLPELLDDPPFAPLREYLADGQPLKRLQLAEKIAYHFDQYLIFRPHWAARWERGESGGDLALPGHLAHEHWQARLWSTLVRGHEHEHRAALLGRALDVLRANPPKTALPQRLAVFGIPTLPPAYLDLLLALGAHVPVSMFLLSPCRHYFGDLPGRRERLRSYRRLVQDGTPLPKEQTTSPLGTLGKMGRDFQNLLLDRGVDELALYRPCVNPRTLLEHVQQRILELAEDAEPPTEPWHADENDVSITAHCCHSPLREMEVLHDLILDMLDRDSSLEPRDILVMTPDMELYAPWIQAVFGNPETPDRRLPFSLADRQPSRATETIRLFLDLVEFGQSRFEASRVCALLDAPGIRQKLRLDEVEAARLRDWVRETGIRWGFDRHFRSTAGLPDYEHNTWESGLRRLFLGYMTGPDAAPIQGVAPVGPLDSAGQDMLGRLAWFADTLAALWTRLNTPGSLQDWRDTLLSLLDNFFPDDRETAEGLLLLRTTLSGLVEEAGDATQLLDLRAMRHLLRARLDESGGENGFLASGLTFCGLRPMRSIPFRVICLCGLSATAFPRQDKRPGFDLLAASPRDGDRSLREDDRYLFLESLISAADRLVLTYPGLSQEDSSESPPSVLVTELFEHLDTHCRIRGGTPSEHLIVRHRLQAFHPDYFTPGKALFSFSIHNLDGARALCSPPAATAFFPPQVGTPDLPSELDLDDLCRFLAHPARHLLRALRLEPAQAEDELLDEEPLGHPNALDAHRLESALVDLALEREDADLESRIAAWNVLPPGEAGRDVQRRLCATARNMADAVRELRHGHPPQTVDIEITLHQCRMHGRLRHFGPRQISHRTARLKGADILRLWVRHLAARASGLDLDSVHQGTDTRMQVPPLAQDAAARHLLDLARLYARGLQEPVPLFPRASLAYARKRFAPKGAADAALRAAQQQWWGGQHLSPERDDRFWSVLYRDHEPDWGAFVTVTEAVYAPILEPDHA